MNLIIPLAMCKKIITVLIFFQNAGAIIGKGGSNIKRLRQDVSICFRDNVTAHHMSHRNFGKHPQKETKQKLIKCYPDPYAD